MHAGPASAPAPQRAANASASGVSSPAARANASPAAKQSPAPYESTVDSGSGAAVNGPPGCAHPPSAPEVVTASFGAGSRSPGRYTSASSFPLPTTRVELDRSALERLEHARRRDEDAAPARRDERVDVARAEVDGVAAQELVPGERVVVTARAEALADDRDRPLAGLVDVDEALALRGLDDGRVHLHPTPLELRLRLAPELVRRRKP